MLEKQKSTLQLGELSQKEPTGIAITKSEK